MNFKALKHQFIHELTASYDFDEAQELFYIAVEKISGFVKTKLIFKPDLEVDIKELQLYQDVIKQLQEGKPIQYILNEAHFYGFTVNVNPAVLIPRPETEELVDWILEEVNLTAINGNILDIGTGSGCIAIALKKHLEDSDVYAMDISADALAVAEKNAIDNKVPVHFIEADVLNYQTDQKFDVIVSNPPYVKEDEKEAMKTNVMAHEPHTALFVSNENPLVFYQAIADFALTNLQPEGYLFFEINEYMGPEMVEMLKLKGLKDIVLKKDMQGKDRMICCRR
jgi:release factor glutamine methyltransferase